MRLTSIALAACLTGALAAPAPATAAVTPAAAPGCHVDYLPSGDEESVRALIVITNTGDDPLLGWTLRFGLPAPQTLTGGRNAVFTAEGRQVTARNLPHNGDVGPGEAVAVLITAAGPVSAGRPETFEVNGLACTQ